MDAAEAAIAGDRRRYSASIRYISNYEVVPFCSVDACRLAPCLPPQVRGERRQDRSGSCLIGSAIRNEPGSPVRSCRTPEGFLAPKRPTSRTQQGSGRDATSPSVFRPGANCREWRDRNVHRSNVPSTRARPGQHPDYFWRIQSAEEWSDCSCDTWKPNP